jgi:hypothetical protein
LRRATAVRGGREARSWVRAGHVQELEGAAAATKVGAVATKVEKVGLETMDGEGCREAANATAAGVSMTCGRKMGGAMAHGQVLRALHVTHLGLLMLAVIRLFAVAS